jgi:[Skp1-protein]-hydroxyproline N-acetylglucosaminyltransferase
LAQTLWRREDYILQIDSHMRFRHNWDEYLIQQCQHIIQQTGHDKVMLTTYPLGYTLPNNIPKQETRGTYLVPWKFDSQGMLRQRGRVLMETHHQPQADPVYGEVSALLPRRHYLYAGGFNFAPSQVLHDVPYDTMGLPHLFFGEELSSTWWLSGFFVAFHKLFLMYTPHPPPCLFGLLISFCFCLLLLQNSGGTIIHKWL